MQTTNTYSKAINLLEMASSKHGFYASPQEHTNYKRIWARDGVICGLAALLDGSELLVKTFKYTLKTLADTQHKLGHIPSNVRFENEKIKEISFGGLAGRVDTISWFVIGVCNYSWFTDDSAFFDEMLPNINKGMDLLEAWEFNNAHLIYVPRSGNWADEYITEGHIFYDQVLRLWALRCLEYMHSKKKTAAKIKAVTQVLESNYKAGTEMNPYHPKAYKNLENSKYWMASLTPSGYQHMFDAFGNSLALLMDLGALTFQKKIIAYSENLRKDLMLKLLPAFWEVLKEGSQDWDLLQNNCKYEFRNFPYEFHNGGTWQMVNGFYAIGVYEKEPAIAKEILKQIEILNQAENFGFYENFNSQTGKAIGVKYCSWSAAAEVIVTQYINNKKLLN